MSCLVRQCECKRGGDILTHACVLCLLQERLSQVLCASHFHSLSLSVASFLQNQDVRFAMCVSREKISHSTCKISDKPLYLQVSCVCECVCIAHLSTALRLRHLSDAQCLVVVAESCYRPSASCIIESGCGRCAFQSYSSWLCHSELFFLVAPFRVILPNARAS